MMCIPTILVLGMDLSHCKAWYLKELGGQFTAEFKDSGIDNHAFKDYCAQLNYLNINIWMTIKSEMVVEAYI